MGRGSGISASGNGLLFGARTSNKTTSKAATQFVEDFEVASNYNQFLTEKINQQDEHIKEGLAALLYKYSNLKPGFMAIGEQQIAKAIDSAYAEKALFEKAQSASEAELQTMFDPTYTYMGFFTLTRAAKKSGNQDIAKVLTQRLIKAIPSSEERNTYEFLQGLGLVREKPHSKVHEAPIDENLWNEIKTKAASKAEKMVAAEIKKAPDHYDYEYMGRETYEGVKKINKKVRAVYHKESRDYAIQEIMKLDSQNIWSIFGVDSKKPMSEAVLRDILNAYHFDTMNNAWKPVVGRARKRAAEPTA